MAADEGAVARDYDRLDLPVRLLARRLDATVRETLPDAVASIKYGVPFYALARPVCYVSAARRHVTFGLLRGARVDDPHGLLVGTGRSPIRKAVLDPSEEPPLDAVRAWLAQARGLDEADEADARDAA